MTLRRRTATPRGRHRDSQRCPQLLELLPPPITASGLAQPGEAHLDLVGAAFLAAQPPQHFVDGEQLAVGVSGGENPPATVPDIATAEGVTPSYATRVLRLAFLAPGITAAILDGRQPPDLTATRLLQSSNIPLA